MDKIDKVEIKDEDLEVKEFTDEELADYTTDWRAKAMESIGIAKRRTTQLGKAKSYMNELEAKIPKEPAPQNKIENKSQSEELDYGQLGWHNSKSGVTKVEHTDDIDFLKDTMKKTGMKQLEVLADDWFVSKLKKRIEEREAVEGTPSSPRRSGGSSKDTVEYWIDKTDRPDDLALRIKIVNARIARDQNKQGNPR